MIVSVFRPLHLEALEEKKLLAADIGLSEAGVINISGTSADDVVIVSQRGNEVVVSHNGEIQFASKDAKSLYFAGGAGDDAFHNETNLPSEAYGNEGNDKLVGGKNVDVLHGGPDDDVIVGNAGNDSLHGDHGDDSLSGGGGHDELYGWYGNDTLDGGRGNDYLSGYVGDDVARGGDGNDTLKGHEGNDQLFGDLGNDKLYGWRGDDLLVGGHGNDYLSAWSGDDILVGGLGNDHLRGHSGNDLLIGGDGKDKLDGGSGEDFFITGYTKYDDNYEVLDKVLSIWNTDEAVRTRYSNLIDFIRTSIANDDRDRDEIYDNRDELDLIVFDRRDRFFNI